jgi:hypothetical protein
MLQGSTVTLYGYYCNLFFFPKESFVLAERRRQDIPASFQPDCTFLPWFSVARDLKSPAIGALKKHAVPH